MFSYRLKIYDVILSLLFISEQNAVFGFIY